MSDVLDIDAPLPPAADPGWPPPGYQPRRPPRARQREALAKMTGEPAFALRAAMRTGKSYCLVNDFGLLVSSGRADDLLVIAPGGVYRTWPDHLARDLPDSISRTTKVLLWDSGRASTKSWRAARDDFLAYRGPRALIVNVEALSSVERARALCQTFVMQRPGRGVVAVDESVVIKNPDSRCGEFVAGRLGPLAGYRRILTGLVAPRGPLDLWNQYRFLDPRILGYDTFVAFRARYAKMRRMCTVPGAQLRGMLKSRLLGGRLTRPTMRERLYLVDPGLDTSAMTDAELTYYMTTYVETAPRDKLVDSIFALGGYVQTIPIVDAYQNVEELTSKIGPYSYRCRLEDCYDMPDSDWSTRDVEWHPEQKRVYEDLRDTATAELASMDHVTATHVIVRMLRLHQVLCGHVVDEVGQEHDVPERRTAALVELLSDYDAKAVVWCSYRRGVERVYAALVKEYGEGCAARFYGDNVATREDEEERFKSDPACRFMIATPDAGGRGRDWSVADLCVYYSSRNDLDRRNQSEERLKAVGKTRPVAYVDLRVPGTVDDKILKCLREKIDLAAVVDGDSWREWVV